MEAVIVPFLTLYKQFVNSTSFDRFDQFLQSYSNFWLIHVTGTAYKEVIPAEGVPIIVDALKDAKISISAIQLKPVEASEETATEYQLETTLKSNYMTYSEAINSLQIGTNFKLQYDTGYYKVDDVYFNNLSEAMQYIQNSISIAKGIVIVSEQEYVYNTISKSIEEKLADIL